MILSLIFVLVSDIDSSSPLPPSLSSTRAHINTFEVLQSSLSHDGINSGSRLQILWSKLTSKWESRLVTSHLAEVNFFWRKSEWYSGISKIVIRIGPSGVRALPVAAGTNEVGHYFWYFSTWWCSSSSSSSYPPTFYPRRDCHRILIFCMGSILTKIWTFQ